ncbi:hypothetical protein [Agromyces protaetiae]|uniref:hypothetical protein n=1 Tax=Agromyces protaetiae TaxID=2509455 RepID=UPI001FB858D7|nr:hypothetical protein [Agromyces protaetiae]
MTGEPSSVAPSLNCTAPEVTAEPFAVTVAVNVTEEPVVDGLADEVRAVEVATAAAAVVIVRLQPPAMEPESPAASSTRYSDHAPLAAMPANAPAKVVCADGVGAGPGNASAVPLSLFVGRKVPLDTVPPPASGPPAASENVRVAFVAGTPAPDGPMSDMNTRFSPVGETSRASMSPVAGCESEASVTVTAVTGPVNPLTVIGDGYALAAPLSGMVMEAVFENVVGPSACAALGTVTSAVTRARTATDAAANRRRPVVGRAVTGRRVERSGVVIAEPVAEKMRNLQGETTTSGRALGRGERASGRGDQASGGGERAPRRGDDVRRASRG